MNNNKRRKVPQGLLIQLLVRDILRLLGTFTN